MASLKDQISRTRFIEELDKNFCVSAGAGVGKTTAIIHRIAKLAEHDPESLSRLVVVTYAVAAAEELRIKSRNLVMQKLSASAHLRQSLLSELRRAFFGTIHSFCLKLIQDQGRFVGLPQNMELLVDSEEMDLWKRF